MPRRFPTSTDSALMRKPATTQWNRRCRPVSEHNTDPARRAEDAADNAATSADTARAAAAKATAAAEETGKNQAVLVPAALGAVTSLLILAAAALGLGLTTASRLSLPCSAGHSVSSPA
jgi:hypothetical protein